MGANATTFVPSYTAGEILTAANLSVTNSGIPVFATTVTRDAAFGGTGEKTLAEGQFAYIEATNTTQYYDGAAWVAVGTTPGLVYITGASFSAVSSVSLPAGTFSSTYRNYRVMLEIFTSTATAANTFRMRAAGTDNTSTGYRLQNQGVQMNGTVSNATQDNATNWNVGSGLFNGSFDVIAPQISTTYTILTGAYVESNASASVGRTMASHFVTLTSFDSMSFITGSGTISGIYRVYGYSES
jgi:hypothetical protein